MEEQKKERFSGRLGFILISAGCAIGIGNVYKFPIWTGAFGGGIFVGIYILCLLLLGLPVMCCELAVGRASGASIATSFRRLEKPGQKWHGMQYLGIAANYALLLSYTYICGWFTVYFVKYLTGSILTAGTVEEISTVFYGMAGSFNVNYFVNLGVVVLCLGICAFGLQNGVERIVKVMMALLFLLLLGLAVYSLTLPGAKEGLQFYLVPDAARAASVGWGTVISKAMEQAFFTLSLGIGSIAIFGASIGKERRLMRESGTIIVLDTAAALLAGLFLFPAYFTYNTVAPVAGDGNPLFLFLTESAVFNNMPGGRIIGALFFLLMVFACYSTVIAVMENIVNFWLEKTQLSRKKIVGINMILFAAVLLPVALGVCGKGIFASLPLFNRSVDGLCDDFVSKLALPLGSLLYVVFCTGRYGWGWDGFYKEVNTGSGPKLPGWLKNYMRFVLPCIIAVILVLSFI